MKANKIAAYFIKLSNAKEENDLTNLKFFTLHKGYGLVKVKEKMNYLVTRLKPGSLVPSFAKFIANMPCVEQAPSPN